MWWSLIGPPKPVQIQLPCVEIHVIGPPGLVQFPCHLANSVVHDVYGCATCHPSSGATCHPLFFDLLTCLTKTLTGHIFCIQTLFEAIFAPLESYLELYTMKFFENI
jgi:hypothetical protein